MSQQAGICTDMWTGHQSTIFLVSTTGLSHSSRGQNASCILQSHLQFMEFSMPATAWQICIAAVTVFSTLMLPKA